MKKTISEKTLLITGGCGFIGSNFIIYILSKYPGYRIINLDALTYAGSLKNLEDVEGNANYTFIRGNICNKKIVEWIFKTYSIDYVVNFAAESHVDRSINDPASFINTNVMGTLVLLKAADKYRRKEKNGMHDPDGGPAAYKFLQVSTDEVYGSLGDEGHFTEHSPISPNNPYSISKASADLLVTSFFKMHGLPVNITRCGNNFGPRQHPEKLIPLCISSAVNGRPIPIYGDGLHVRDWIFVLDHCAAIDAVLHNGAAGEIYNVSARNERKNISIVKTILRHLKNNYGCNATEKLIHYVGDRKSHDRRYAMDPSKIMSDLGWSPGTSFEDGLRETIDWYLSHKGWMRAKAL